MPIPNSPTRATPRAPKHAPGSPEAYLDAIEARSRRRIFGGALALHRRGQSAFGALWTPALAATASGGLVLVLRLLLRAPRSAHRTVLTVARLVRTRSAFIDLLCKVER